MNKTITFLKFGFQNLRLFAMLLLGSGAALSFGQNYNTTTGHRLGCYSADWRGTCTNYAAAIEEVTIEDENGNVIYTKNADGCNDQTCVTQTTGVAGQHHSVVASTSAFTLSGGSKYKLFVTTSNPNGFTWTNSAAVYLDFNGDKDFEDAGEYIGRNPNFGAGTRIQFDINVPCGMQNGDIRLRIRSNAFNFNWNASTHSGGNPNYGETEDFNGTYNSPAIVNADFNMPDSAFVGTQALFTNTNQTGYISHKWTIDGTEINSTNADYIFSTGGVYDVKLVSENCVGLDSITKQFRVVEPQAPPVANFASDKNVVELYEVIQLYDLSSNGPTFWNWFVTNGVDTLDGDDILDFQGNFIGVNDQPIVESGDYFGALDVGSWDVCLEATNGYLGGSTSPVVCKKDYITVVQSIFELGPNQTTAATSGTLYDDGGELGDYTSTGGTQRFTIAPCGSDSLTLYFDMFDVNTNVNLKIYDGTNEAGTPRHTGEGFTSANLPPDSILSNTGSLHLVWDVVSNGRRDPGLAARWKSRIVNSDDPIADFDMGPNVLYNGVPFTFTNTSENVDANTVYEWTLTGPPGTVTKSSTDFSELFGLQTDGAYTLSLKLTTCDNKTSTVTKSFDVNKPDSPTEIDFTADNRRPALDGDVVFTALSDKANRWEWSFFPPTGVTEVAPLGSIRDNERTFKFSAPGAYAVQLKGYNSVDSALNEAQVVKTSYILVTENCTPTVRIKSQDVGISYVSIQDADKTGEKYENSSEVGQEGYTDYSDIGTIPVNYGGTYTVEVERNTTVNNITRAIWVDWNVDGDFTDPLEQVALDTFPNNNKKWTTNITIPTSAIAFDAQTTLRIGVAIDNNLNLPCGNSTRGDANVVGEFEDYSIRVINDGDIPVISLIGQDTIYVEQVATGDPVTYESDSATAVDPSQGDITPNIDMVTDLDQYLAGVYYEDYNVMDASGNEAEEVTRVIYVVADQTAPVITLNGTADTTIEVGTMWVDPLGTARDNKEGDLTSSIITSGMVNAELLGDYTITYFISDNQGNSSSTTRIVRVVDTQLPIIENASADKSGACWNVEVQLQNIFADITTATDNYNLLGSGLTLKADPASAQGGASVDTRFQGTTTVTYTATDESGNVATQCVDYVVRDYIAPVIDLNTLPTVEHNVNEIYTPVAATATDNLYNSTQISLTSTSNVDAYTLGTYQDTYTAIDAAGNESTKVRTVNVVDNESPVITGKSGGVLKLGVGSQYDAINSLNFSDNYDAPEDLLANLTTMYNDVNLQEAGLYSFIVETADNSGNESNQFTLYVDVRYEYEKVIAGVEDVNLDDLMSVSPNPSSGTININVNLPENENIDIAVYNSLGKQVVLVTNGEVKNNTYAIDLNNQANGIYYVKMNVKGSIVTKKIILNK